MFVPGEPRFEEMARLAARATGSGLLDRERPRWRELCAQLLGSLRAREPGAERRQVLRAGTRLQVTLLAPEEVQGLVTSSISSGGLSLWMHKALPLGVDVEMSIALEERLVPLLTRGQVVSARVLDGGCLVGVAFTALVQGERERLEGLAVRALLAAQAAQ